MSASTRHVIAAAVLDDVLATGWTFLHRFA
jgi:hypothetical protein